MAFDQIYYYMFLLVVTALQVPQGFRLCLLLFSSLLFYLFFGLAAFSLIIGLFFSTWYFSLKIIEAKNKSPWLLFSLLLVFTPLVFFKYVMASKNYLPLGISFYSFHAASYLIDAYRGKLPELPKVKNIAVYLSFFPQLIAGPITRASEFIPQLQKKYELSFADVQYALVRIFSGLFKKFTIANAIFLFLPWVLRSPEDYNGITLFFALLAARYYIYADFSAYTDIAIGSARLLGIQLPENFNRPFAATNISEYWRRWHISLSTWIRDYVFFPLSLSKFGGFLGLYPLIIITFLLLGLWHGAKANFLIYGLWHGLAVVFYEIYRKKFMYKQEKELGLKKKALYAGLLYVLIIAPSGIIFLSDSLPAVAHFFQSFLKSGNKNMFDIPMLDYRFITALISIAILEALGFFQVRFNLSDKFLRLSLTPKLLLSLAAVFYLLLMGEFTLDNGFVYFRF